MKVLERAIQFVYNKKGSVRMASRLFKIPRSSIHFKLKNPDSKFGSGHIPYLTEEVEADLVEFIIDLSKRGFPQKKEDIKTSVQDYLKKQPRDSKNPFADNRPGDGWYFKFIQRHRNALKNVEDFEDGDGDETEIWFKKIGDHIMLENLSDVIEDPNRVFILDETIFNICVKTGTVYVEGTYNTDIEKAKEKITVTFSYAANGSYCNPMIIYPCKKVPDKIAESIPVGWGFGRNETGLMTSEIFYEYIINVFITKVKEDPIKFPVILFVDGYKTHVTLDVLELCNSLQIHLIAIYRNYNKTLSPYGVSLIHPVKSAWKKGMKEKNEREKEAANKFNFAPFLQSIIDSHINPLHLIEGFKVSGLYPFYFSNIKEINDNKSLTDTQSQSTADDAENNEDKKDYLYFSD